ncbi:hypothetical protein I5U56_06470 [Stenotrophomonas maltophilia]|nr:hypothetical protein [Stenotrophomonas maltophilia]MBH1600332.1 hypothetical protein [Stenotrophomonas maltophilia]
MGAIEKRALLDQRSVLITADDPQVVSPPAAGAHEVQPEAVDVGLDLTEPGERLAAVDALEHDPGVRPGGDGEATADHSARYLVGPADDDSAMVVQMSGDVAEAHSKARIARSFSIAARPEVP